MSHHGTRTPLIAPKFVCVTLARTGLLSLIGETSRVSSPPPALPAPAPPLASPSGILPRFSISYPARLPSALSAPAPHFLELPTPPTSLAPTHRIPSDSVLAPFQFLSNTTSPTSWLADLQDRSLRPSRTCPSSVGLLLESFALQAKPPSYQQFSGSRRRWANTDARGLRPRGAATRADDA